MQEKIKAGTANYVLTCINNLQAEYSESRSLPTPFGKNTAKQIFILENGSIDRHQLH